MLKTYSPAIAPPNSCTILQCLAELFLLRCKGGASREKNKINEFVFSSEAPPTFGEVKVVKLFETEMDALKFCSTSVRNPYSYLLLRLLNASINNEIPSMTVIVPCLAIC